MSAPLTPRQAFLLRQQQGLREDLAAEADPDARDAYRAEIAAIDHSLWLAGYVAQERAA